MNFEPPFGPVNLLWGMAVQFLQLSATVLSWLPLWATLVVVGLIVSGIRAPGRPAQPSQVRRRRNPYRRRRTGWDFSA